MCAECAREYMHTRLLLARKTSKLSGTVRKATVPPSLLKDTSRFISSLKRSMLGIDPLKRLLHRFWG